MNLRLGWPLAAAVVFSCAPDTRVTGNGSETTTGLSARVLGADGHPANGAVVQWRPSRWNPDTSGNFDPFREAIADSEGIVHFENLPAGSWQLVAMGPGGKAQTVLEKGDGLLARRLDFQLASTSRIQGHIDIPAGDHAWVTVAGLPGGVRPDAAGNFVLEGLPSGTLSLQVVDWGDSLRRSAVAVSTTSGLTTEAGSLKPLARSKADPRSDSARIEFDLGGARRDTLFGYPLLLRLSDTAMDFAKTHGTDLQFERSGRILSHQVEQWDPIGRTAAVWVRIDTLLPTDRNLSLVLRYGGPGLPDWGDSKSVFRTSDGWVGVWHLDAADPGQEAVADLRARNWRTLDASGLAGRGRFCDTGWMRIADAPQLHIQSHTISCWAKRKGNQIPIGKLISKGNLADWHNTWSLQTFDKSYRIGLLTLRIDSVSDTLRTPTALIDGGWSLVAATWNATSGRQRIFVDGVAVDSSLRTGLIDYRNRPPIDMELFLGANFIGTLDEARISKLPRSPDWIALDHLIQKPGSRTARFLR